MDEEAQKVMLSIQRRLVKNVMPLFIANLLSSGFTEEQTKAVLNSLMEAFAEDKEIMDGV